MKKRSLLLAALLLVGAGCLKTQAGITSFEECVAAGNAVMESYPRQCRAGETTFVEDVAVPPEQPPAEEAWQGETVTLMKGESKTFKGGLKVQLTAIDDSRCPKDVQCVWAGELAAVLEVTLIGSGDGPTTLRLGKTTTPDGMAFGHALLLTEIDETSATISVSPVSLE